MTSHDGLVQEKRNSIALAMELGLSCINHRYEQVTRKLCFNDITK